MTSRPRVKLFTPITFLSEVIDCPAKEKNHNQNYGIVQNGLYVSERWSKKAGPNA